MTALNNLQTLKLRTVSAWACRRRVEGGLKARQWRPIGKLSLNFWMIIRL